MKKNIIVKLVLILIFIGCWIESPACTRENTVHVTVASNFVTTLDVLAQAFTHKTQYCVEKSVAATTVLYQQIINGAPFDLFLSADTLRPSLLVQRGLALPEYRASYAEGQLVLAAPYDAHPAKSQFLNQKNLTIAMGNPASSPYGQAAKEVLMHLHLWPLQSGKLIMTNDVSQVLTELLHGKVDAAFVSLAQIKYLLQQDKSKTEFNNYWLIPSSHYQPIVQQMVLLKNSLGDTAARAFFTYLTSAGARQIIAGAGYILPPKRRTLS